MIKMVKKEEVKKIPKWYLILSIVLSMVILISTGFLLYYIYTNSIETIPLWISLPSILLNNLWLLFNVIISIVFINKKVNKGFILPLIIILWYIFRDLLIISWLKISVNIIIPIVVIVLALRFLKNE